MNKKQSRSVKSAKNQESSEPISASLRIQYTFHKGNLPSKDLCPPKKTLKTPFSLTLAGGFISFESEYDNAQYYTQHEQH